MEGGQAGGILVEAGEAFNRDGEAQTKLHFAYMVPLTWVFQRVREVLGRNLEVPIVHDLSRKVIGTATMVGGRGDHENAIDSTGVCAVCGY